VVALASPLAAGVPAPAGAILLPDIRWQRCDIKAVTLLPNVLMRQEAREAGALEAILVRDGQVTEGAASNVFVVRGAEVATPPKCDLLLGGITRDLVVELLAGTEAPVTERPVAAQELGAADEIWLTSSTRELVPVVTLDGRPVGGGEPGPRWREAWQRFQRCKRESGRRGSGEASGDTP
jgi:D-alanine transaminase